MSGSVLGGYIAVVNKKKNSFPSKDRRQRTVQRCHSCPMPTESMFTEKRNFIGVSRFFEVANKHRA